LKNNRVFSALNRNEIPAAVQAFDPQIKWIEPAEYPTGETYQYLSEGGPLSSRLMFPSHGDNKT
jgi:hypothetical protein